MPENRDANNWKLSTKLVHGGTLRTPFGETSEALFLNSAYVYASAEEAEARFSGGPGFKYGRYSHPNLQMLEDRLSLMEGAESCIVTASGMAAVFASMLCQLKSGDHVAAGRGLFSSCHYIITEILPRYGITYTLVPGDDLAAWEKAITPATRCVFIETPANPTLEVVDIAAVAALCKKHRTRLLVDNVFPTPVMQHPLTLGADVVIYSTTKHIDGQGRTLGGAILGSKEFIEEVARPFCRHTGPHMSPFTAWVLLKSLETLELRAARHCESAAHIARRLEAHPKVARLLYPGLPSHPQYTVAQMQMKSGGPMLAFELTGGKAAAFRFMNALTLIAISNNLGDAKTLIVHPPSTTHHSMGEAARAQADITDGLLRLSVGLEDPEDLMKDIDRALERA